MATNTSVPTLIQRVVFPVDRQASLLYLRPELTDGSGDVPPVDRMPHWDRRSVLVPQGVAISLGTLFNQLPEAYWLEYTEASGFAFSAVVSGIGEIHVLRRTKSGEDVLLAVQSFDTIGAQAEGAAIELTIDAPPDRATGAGVLFARIGARSGPVILGEAGWSALGVTPAPVRLVAGFCTFKREQQVAENVRAVMADTIVRRQLTGLVVVDQGQSESLGTTMDSIGQDYDDDVISFIQQDNFGGAGGFTRIMLEALETDGATHVLLMDDDAKTETESIFRTVAFLSLSKNVAVGGQMLDLFRPTSIYEAGAWFLPDRMTIRGNTPNLNAAQPASLTTFATVTHTDYNGWWFFATPLEVLRAQGLPLPMFIRGDDIEHGIRLTQNGVETVTVPGIAVWHEPFYAKRTQWQEYYYWRNLIIYVSLRYGLSGGKAARHFRKSFMQMLLCHRYDAAALQCLGFADWLKGPQVLRDPPHERHANLFKATKSSSAGPVAAKLTKPAIPDISTQEQLVSLLTPPKGWRLARAFATILLKNLFGREQPPLAAPLLSLPPICEILWWQMSRYPDAAIRPAPWTAEFTGVATCHRLCRSPRAFRRLLPRGLVLYGRLLLMGGQRARQWQSEAKSLQSIEFWKGYLGIDGRPSDGSHEATLGPGQPVVASLDGHRRVPEELTVS